MPIIWKLQDAKNRFSEVVDKAIEKGPQTITRRGTPVAVVLSSAEYQRLAKPKKSLVQFFRDSPLAEIMKEHEVDFTRSRDTGRKVEL